MQSPSQPTTSITLYGYATSPFVMKVGCYLKYKQLPFKHVPVNPLRPKQIRFTRQRRVPVLEIGDEWRLESSELGVWIDEVCPERPLLGRDAAERAVILEQDRWISEALIPSRFREVVDWTNSWDALRNGWRLAEIVDSGTPLPSWVRLIWPLAVKRAGFILRMVDDLDRTEPMPTMRHRLASEFVERLNGGDYLGGTSAPSLADLSAYPILLFGHMVGMRGDQAWLEHPEIVGWMQRIQQHLPDNPFLADERFLEREFPFERTSRGEARPPFPR